MESQTPQINPDFGKEAEQLIIENEKFAYSIVNKEFCKYSYSAKEELFSAAKYGLIYAASKYDSHQHKTKFISYAVWWIRYYVHEEVRKFNPIKLNQNHIIKRNKITRAARAFEAEYGRSPTDDELSALVDLSTKVVGNIYSVNKGENFNFVSFQAQIASGNSKDGSDDSSMESKLMKEYYENSSNSEIYDYELKDLLEVLESKLSEEDYNIFIDKHMNDMSYSDIAIKYKLNFPSSASYRLKVIEKQCRKLV